MFYGAISLFVFLSSRLSYSFSFIYIISVVIGQLAFLQLLFRLFLFYAATLWYFFCRFLFILVTKNRLDTLERVPHALWARVTNAINDIEGT